MNATTGGGYAPVAFAAIYPPPPPVFADLPRFFAGVSVVFMLVLCVRSARSVVQEARVRLTRELVKLRGSVADLKAAGGAGGAASSKLTGFPWLEEPETGSRPS